MRSGDNHLLLESKVITVTVVNGVHYEEADRYVSQLHMICSGNVM